MSESTKFKDEPARPPARPGRSRIDDTRPSGNPDIADDKFTGHLVTKAKSVEDQLSRLIGKMSRSCNNWVDEGVDMIVMHELKTIEAGLESIIKARPAGPVYERAVRVRELVNDIRQETSVHQVSSARSLKQAVDELVHEIREGDEGPTLETVALGRTVSREEKLKPLVDRLRKALADPTLSNAREAELIKEVEDGCSSYARYQELHEERGHRFMDEEAQQHPAIDRLTSLLEHLPKKQQAELGILELGPGIGKAAAGMLERLNGRPAAYYGIDGSPVAVTRTDERLSHLQKTFPDGRRPEVKIIQGDFRRELPKMGALIESGMAESWVSKPITDVVSVSTLHYFSFDKWKELLMAIRQILVPTRGRLTLSLKTPEATTYHEHMRIKYKDGYNIGLDTREGIMRVFMREEKVRKTLEEVGFEIVRDDIDTVTGYDRPGQDEVFYTTISQPKND